MDKRQPSLFMSVFQREKKMRIDGKLKGLDAKVTRDMILHKMFSLNTLLTNLILSIKQELKRSIHNQLKDLLWKAYEKHIDNEP